MVNINQKDTTNKNLQDAIGERAEQDGRHLEGEVRQAARSEGGVGGRSGTGQAQPHHGFDDRQGRKAMGEPEDPDNILPVPENGPGYQSGGTGLDTQQQVTEAKQAESGAEGKSRSNGPGMDPPPGAPVKPNH